MERCPHTCSKESIPVHVFGAQQNVINAEVSLFQVSLRGVPLYPLNVHRSRLAYELVLLTIPHGEGDVIKCCISVVGLQDECTEVRDVSQLPQLTTNPDDYDIFQSIGKEIVLPAGMELIYM